MSAATAFYLIRHGLTDLVHARLSSRTPGISLNQTGRAQAVVLADGLDGVSFAAIYSSPLERAIETAQPLALRRDLEVHVLPALVEFEFGGWTMQAFDDIMRDPEWARFNSWRSVLRAPGAGGESMLDVQARAVTELARLAKLHPGGRVAIVSHADTIRAILLHALGAPADFVMRIDIQPASASIVEFGEWGPRVLAMNWTPAAPGKEEQS